MYPPEDNATGLNQDRYILQLFPYEGTTEEYSITYLEWSDADVDTLRYEFDRAGGSIVGTSVWCNGELVWNTADQTARSFEIVK